MFYILNRVMFDIYEWVMSHTMGPFPLWRHNNSPGALWAYDICRSLFGALWACVGLFLDTTTTRLFLNDRVKSVTILAHEGSALGQTFTWTLSSRSQLWDFNMNVQSWDRLDRIVTDFWLVVCSKWETTHSRTHTHTHTHTHTWMIRQEPKRKRER